jgi:hypothetical protein
MVSIVSSWANVRRPVESPLVALRRPVKRIVAEYGPPSSPESNHAVATRASGSTACGTVGGLCVCLTPPADVVVNLDGAPATLPA